VQPIIGEEEDMLKWALIFAVVSIIAGIFGFTGIAADSAAIAKVLFYIAVIVFVVLLALGLFAGKKLSK
jgi:uncharacterized membrane protein YtjA (UPF0391 family)